MKHFRIAKNVPDVYVRESRDFQLFCNIFDLMYGSVKFNIDSILSILNTELCPDKLLSLLKTKLGFFTSFDIPHDKLRVILKNFPYVIKNKGSRTGIYQAIITYLRCMNLDTIYKFDVINNADDNNLSGNYVINIGINEITSDIQILQELFKYVLPPGYNVNYYLYSKMSPEDFISSRDTINVIIVDEKISSGVVKSSSDNLNSKTSKDNFNFVGQTTVIMSDSYNKVNDPNLSDRFYPVKQFNLSEDQSVGGNDNE